MSPRPVRHVERHLRQPVRAEQLKTGYRSRKPPCIQPSAGDAHWGSDTPLNVLIRASPDTRTSKPTAGPRGPRPCESAACSPVQLALRASTFSAAVEPHAGRFLVLGRLVATASIHLGSDRQFAATPLRACETSVAPLMNSSSRYPQAARLGKRRHQLVWLDGLDRYRVRT